MDFFVKLMNAEGLFRNSPKHPSPVILSTSGGSAAPQEPGEKLWLGSPGWVIYKERGFLQRMILQAGSQSGEGLMLNPTEPTAGVRAWKRGHGGGQKPYKSYPSQGRNSSPFTRAPPPAHVPLVGTTTCPQQVTKRGGLGLS